MSRAEAADLWLQGLYDQVPVIECKGLCDDACGPIGMGRREHARMAQAGYRMPTHAESRTIARGMWARGQEYSCPALVDGRCGAYEVRPMICRVWGVSEFIECPYGCADDVDLLSYPYAQWLLSEAALAGQPLAPRKSLDVFHEFFTHPEMQAKAQMYQPERRDR